MACTTGLGTGDPAMLQDLECIFTRVVGTLIPIAGLLFFIMFLMGGFKYITSGGDPKAVASAHATLTYATIGITIAALSYMLLYIIYYLTGNAQILNFNIFVN
jgi:hypothetical protein